VPGECEATVAAVAALTKFDPDEMPLEEVDYEENEPEGCFVWSTEPVKTTRSADVKRDDYVRFV